MKHPSKIITEGLSFNGNPNYEIGWHEVLKNIYYKLQNGQGMIKVVKGRLYDVS